MLVFECEESVRGKVVGSNLDSGQRPFLGLIQDFAAMKILKIAVICHD